MTPLRYLTILKLLRVIENSTEILITLDVFDETLPISYVIAGVDADFFELDEDT